MFTINQYQFARRRELAAQRRAQRTMSACFVVILSLWAIVMAVFSLLPIL